MRRVHLTLGTRLVVTLLLFAVLPVAATAFFTLREQERALRAEALGRAQQVAQLLAPYVDLFVRERQGDLQGLADTLTFRSAVIRRDWRAVQQALDAIARHDPALRGVVAIDSDGTVRAATGVAAGLVGRDASVFPASAMARERRALVVSDPFPSPVDRQPIVSLAVPILQGPGTPPVLGAGVDLNLLAVEVRRVRLGAGGFAVVQTADGRIIVHPDTSRFLALASEGNRAPALTRRGPTGALETVRPDGTRDFTGFATVPEVNWVVLAHLPEREALAGLAALRRRALMMTGWLILLVLGAAVMHGRVLARPLRELAAAARAMGSGDLTRRVPVRRADEVGELASAFNEMADRRQQAEAALQAAIARRDTLTGLSAAIAAGSEHVEIVRQVVSATARLLSVPYAALWRLDAEGARLIIAAELVDPALGPLPPQPPMPFERSLAYGILREGQPAVVPDVRQDPRWANRTWPGLEHLAAYIGVPLAREGNLVGALVAMDRPGRAFTDEEGELLRSLGTQAALALEKARLLEEARQAAAQAHALVEVGKLLTETVDLNTVLARIADKATELLGANACCVRLVERSEGGEPILRIAYSWGLHPGHQRVQELRVGEGMSGRAVQKRHPVWTADILNDPAISLSEEGRQRVLEHKIPRAVLAAPMVREDAVIGVLSLHRPPGTTYNADEVQVLSAMAAQAAIAIENARLFEKQREAAAQAEALAEVGRALNATLELDRVLDVIIQEVERVTAAPFVGFMALDPERQELAYVKGRGLGEERMASFRLRLGEGIAGRAVQQGVPLQSSDLAGDPRYARPGLAVTEGFRSILCVPLRAAGRPLGALVLFQKDEHEFTRPEVDLVTRFADQAAVALHNAELYAAELAARREAEEALARVKQLQGLLPICSYCKKIRDDQNYWQQVEHYVAEHSEAQFSHGICPECYKNIARPEMERLIRGIKKGDEGAS